MGREYFLKSFRDECHCEEWRGVAQAQKGELLVHHYLVALAVLRFNLFVFNKELFSFGDFIKDLG